MIEILINDDKYLLYARDIIYVNAYNSSDGYYYIDINLTEKQSINLDFEDDTLKYLRTYELIIKKMSEVE